MFDEAGPISVVRLDLDLPVFLPKLLSLQTRAVNNSQQGRSKPSAAISSISDQSTRVTEEKENEIAKIFGRKYFDFLPPLSHYDTARRIVDIIELRVDKTEISSQLECWKGWNSFYVEYRLMA